MLSSHLRLGLPCGLFPSGFPTKTLYKNYQQGTELKFVHKKNCFGSVFSISTGDGPEHSLQYAYQQRTVVFRAMFRPIVRLIHVGNVGFPAGIRAGAFR
jgi:hypothetical protein